MKGAKPKPIGNVVPMRGDIEKPVAEAPEMMTEEGKAVWSDLSPTLAKQDRLAHEFRYQFMSYCEAVATFIAATNEVALHGMWYETTTRNGVQQKKTAAWSMQQEAMNQMRRDSALFGLTPVDAARLSSGGQGDLFDQLSKALNGGAD